MNEVPEFPGRPDHPDFWLLSQAILDLDAQANSGQPVADIIGRHLDPESVIYMASQRADRALMSRTKIRKGLLGATWIDGFIAGMAVQHLKTQGTEGERP